MNGTDVATGERGWRLPLLAREALQSVRTSRRLRPLLVVAVLVGPALAAVAGVEAIGLDRDRAALDEAGARVIVLAGSAEQPVTIDRASCEGLAKLPGVERAGALLASTRTAVLPLGPAVAVVPTSPSLLPELTFADSVVGADLVSRAERVERLDTGVVLTAAPGANQPEGIPLDRALAVPIAESVREIDRCIVVVDQGAPLPTVAGAALGALTVSGPLPVATPVLAQPLDATEQFLQRPTRWLPLAVGIIAGLATIALGATRLSEFAAYRLSGTRPKELAAILGLESLALAGVAAVSGVAAALLLSPWLVSGVTTAAGSLVVGATWWAIAAIGLAPLARISPLRLSKER